MSIVSAILSLHSIPCIFPFYHGVAEHTPAFARHLYRMPTPEQFEKDLAFFLTHFTPISLEDLLERPGKSLPSDKPRFHLSFDDGLSLCLDPIKSILLKKGIPATFFINSAFVGNKELFYRYKVSLLIDCIQESSPSPDLLNQIADRLSLSDSSPSLLCQQLKQVTYADRESLGQLAEVLHLDFSQFLENERPYMDESQVQELFDAGFSLGGHSMSHPLYKEIAAEEQVEQSLQSVSYVSERFKVPYRVFAFPFTDDGVRKEVFESLYAGGIQASFGTAGLKRDVSPRHHQRIPMEKWPYSAPWVVSKALGLYLPKMLLGMHQIKR